MNKVFVSITCLTFSPLWFNLRLRSPSSMLLHNELQYEIAIIAQNMFSPNHQTCFLQIAEHFFSKSLNMFSSNCQCILPNMFLQITEQFAPNLQDISPISEQHTFFSVLFGEEPVPDLSLHVPRAPRSALWVVGCGSLVTPVPPTRPRALRSTLWTMG